VVNSNGTLVTNAHVVGQSQTAGAVLRRVDRDRAVSGVDASKDLAVLKVDAATSSGAQPPTRRVRTGELAVATGSPLGLDQTPRRDRVGTGRHVQAPNGVDIDRVIRRRAINPGNSGGPLLNASAR
jgi:S1-C subfamily serine protease